MGCGVPEYYRYMVATVWRYSCDYCYCAGSSLYKEKAQQIAANICIITQILQCAFYNGERSRSPFLKISSLKNRLGAVRRADKIIVLDHGSIAESGNFEQLIEQQGRFYHIWNEQAKWYHAS